MRRTVLVARRVVRQLLRNPRFLVLSVAAPLVIVYLLKIFFDTLPETFDVARYAVPVAAFLVHFMAFLLCAISLERVMNLGENRIGMRIPQSAWFPRNLRFPHSYAVSNRVHNSL